MHLAVRMVGLQNCVIVSLKPCVIECNVLAKHCPTLLRGCSVMLAEGVQMIATYCVMLRETYTARESRINIYLEALAKPCAAIVIELSVRDNGV